MVFGTLVQFLAFQLNNVSVSLFGVGEGYLQEPLWYLLIMPPLARDNFLCIGKRFSVRVTYSLMKKLIMKSLLLVFTVTPSSKKVNDQKGKRR